MEGDRCFLAALALVSVEDHESYSWLLNAMLASAPFLKGDFKCDVLRQRSRNGEGPY
jgi:hypothetical protein